MTHAKPILEHDIWIFDLDNTLYPASNGLFPQVEVRIRDFVRRVTGLAPEEAFDLQKQYLKAHGTTLKGLMTHHQIDPDEYLAYVHDIDFSPIQAAPQLEASIKALPGRKFVFTNADAPYTAQVLARLGMTHLFEDVFDITRAGLTPKPHQSTYDKMVAECGIAPNQAVMVEDMARNLKPAHDMGMTTVWVHTDNVWGHDGKDEGHIHHTTHNLTDFLTNALT